jgi:hypothetical protein
VSVNALFCGRRSQPLQVLFAHPVPIPERGDCLARPSDSRGERGERSPAWRPGSALPSPTRRPLRGLRRGGAVARPLKTWVPRPRQRRGRGGREAAGEGALVGRSPPLRLGFAEPPLPHFVGARNPSWNETAIHTPLCPARHLPHKKG